MSAMTTIITVLDNATETSMPFNEFVIYRASHFLEEKHVLVLCDKNANLPHVSIPEGLEILYTGRSLWRIRKCLIELIRREKRNDNNTIIHLHQVQSGFLVQLAILGSNNRKKVLFTVHSSFSGYKFHNKILSLYNVALARRITCVGYSSYQDYPRLIKIIKGSRIQPIQNGVDLERIDNIQVESIGEKNTVSFIYVARMVPLKNHVFLLDVLKQCELRVRFVFVGMEDLQKEIRKKAMTAGVAERIRFTGLIPRDEVYRELKQADCYISSSTVEGLPISVLEAMYCGLPCILSDIPPHREIASHETILLPFDIKKWATEINKVAEQTIEERKHYSQVGKEYVANNFSLWKMHKKYGEIYEQM